MTDLTIWHNPKCSKSRQTLALIKDSGKTVDIRNYLDDPPTEKELGIALELLDIPARQLLRKGESAYKALGLNNLELTERDLIEAMHSAPKLIERPIVFTHDRAVLGRPPENVLELL